MAKNKEEMMTTLEKVRKLAFKDKDKILGTITNVALALLQKRGIAHANMMLHTEEMKEYLKDDDETEKEE